MPKFKIQLKPCSNITKAESLIGVKFTDVRDHHKFVYELKSYYIDNQGRIVFPDNVEGTWTLDFLKRQLEGDTYGKYLIFLNYPIKS